MTTKPDAPAPADRAAAPKDEKNPAPARESAGRALTRADKPRPVEIGGRKGPDPTRYGDWEKDGRAIDF